MIAANIAVFEHLERFCIHRGDPITTAGKTRYIQGDSQQRHVLKKLQARQSLRFGQRRSLTRFTIGGVDFVVLVGFEFVIELPQLIPISLEPGMGTCVLSELLPQPIAGSARVRDIVEVGSAEDGPGYEGHHFDAVASLFPSIQPFEATDALDDDGIWRLFLMLCVQECRHGESWINDELGGELLTLADVNVDALPYGALCQSIFDADPRSLYMSLYRCVEATYAYESTRRLVAALNVEVPWWELAAALESEVGWHPREAASLNLVLKYALVDDLRRVCDCLDAPLGGDPQVAAGRAIYQLRNTIVHHRPGQPSVDLETVDWNELCMALVGIVFSVFSQAYLPSA